MLTGHDVSSLVVDRLCDQFTGRNIAVTCFYLDFAARKEQSVASILGSLLRQVVGGMETVPEEITQAFQGQKMAIGGRGPRLPDIVKMLQAITTSLPTFVGIDALDECAAANRVKLLNSLQQILETSRRTRIFIIGRPHVRAEVEKRLAGRVMSVPVSPSKNDITEYLRLRIDEDETPDAMDESLEEDILEKIPEHMSEMYVRAMVLGVLHAQCANRYASRFLLVSLNIDAILNESTISRRRERLRKMTSGLELGDVYGATIERIKAQGGDKSRLGMTALMWISHAERPLQADELCHALAVQLGSTDFDVGNIPSISTVVSCCQGLISVDKEGSTVRLIHFTLQEFLSTRPDILGDPHSAIAEVCLTYLSSQQVNALWSSPSSDAAKTPFLGYCSIYWGVHAKRELSDYGRSLALELLKEDYGPISTKLLLEQSKRSYTMNFDTCSPFSGLHCASFFGIVEIVAGLTEMGCYDINGGDFSGRTPLAWAACSGHEEVVKVLLGQGEVSPDRADNFGQTPLLLAAEEGYEGVVKILLGREEVNPDKPDSCGLTPLSFAAWGGHKEVVSMLLGREEVGPDKPNSYGKTPLSWAALSGHVGVVEILLEQAEVDPDRPSNRGRTPLSFAAEYGHVGVVEILLEQAEVDPEWPDNDGRTPLSWAADSGHVGVVKILLEQAEVNPDWHDNDDLTPLSIAAMNGREGVVKILLGREEVNPDRQDNGGRTPLSFAAENGYEGVVKILLGREGVNPDKPDIDGLTPLSFAARWGHEDAVEILLREEWVNPDKPDKKGRTPLSFAVEEGHTGVVKILLGREEVNPDKPDNGGLTPLSYASNSWSENVAALLQACRAATPGKV